MSEHEAFELGIPIVPAQSVSFCCFVFVMYSHFFLFEDLCDPLEWAEPGQREILTFEAL